MIIYVPSLLHIHFRNYTDRLFCVQILKVENHTPVKNPFARHSLVVDVCVLSLFCTTNPTKYKQNLYYKEEQFYPRVLFLFYSQDPCITYSDALRLSFKSWIRIRVLETNIFFYSKNTCAH